MSELYYKAARPDGWDFHTGKTINYRESIGQDVRVPSRPHKRGYRLCSSDVIHACLNPDSVFIGASIPLSLYEVTGRPVCEDGEKSGFRSLFVQREVNPADVFKWRYDLAANPVKPLAIKAGPVTPEVLALLKAWASVKASVNESVWASVKESVNESVWTSVWNKVGVSMWALEWDEVWDEAWESVKESVWESMRASMRKSARESVEAYFGHILAPVVDSWGYVDHEPGVYPFQPAVDLWNLGLIPSFDGKLWRLHAGRQTQEVWKGTIEEARDD